MLFVIWLQKTQNYAFVTLFVGRVISPYSQVQGKVTDLIFNGRHASQMKKKNIWDEISICWCGQNIMNQNKGNNLIVDIKL